MNEWEWQLLEDRVSVDHVTIAGVEVRPGDRVRLRPRPAGDVLDLALAGREAIVHSIEQDYEGELHLSVVIEDDPGSDLGRLRQPGHRFFFKPAEVEPIGTTGAAPDPAAATTILVAGIGNIFMGDDGFGVEVAQRLAQREWPAGVRVVDFGIRGYDLVYALQDGPDVTILVDACPRGGQPGSVYVVEPDLASLEGPAGATASIDAHGMDPMNVLRLAKAMGATLNRILLVGCEPLTLGSGEGLLGLSDPVEASVAEAEAVICGLVGKIRSGDL